MEKSDDKKVEAEALESPEEALSRWYVKVCYDGCKKTKLGNFLDMFLLTILFFFPVNACMHAFIH